MLRTSLKSRAVNPCISSAAVLAAIVFAGCTPQNPNQQTSAPVASAPTPPGRVIAPTGPPNYTSKAAGFAIWLPVAKPQVQHSSESTQWGQTEMYVVQAKTAPVTYVIVSRSIPSGVDTSNPTEFMDGVLKGYLQGGQGKLVTSEDINLNGIAGRDVLSSLKEGVGLTRLRIYFTTKTSFQVMAIGLKAEVQKQKAQIAKVMDSFRLVEK